LRLARVVLERGPEPEEVYDFDNDAERSVFVCGPLTIEARTQGVYEDFRMTGRIYLEGVDAVDR
ncbi:MAG TPA: hypothetical protein PK393_11355, partial [Synergistaceae bacterium]|nr:hypothetical protein [Synergistaceae bacterium]